MTPARTRVLHATALMAVVGGLLLCPGDTRAQGPTADWRTITTAHFRVHYPAEFEAWTLLAAARLDAVRARLIDVIGHEPDAIVDVIVSDAVAAPNGLAIPLLTWPRIVLFTTPPAADEDIGNIIDWGEILVVHEDAHIVHLTRPSRNPVRRVLSRIWIPLGPMATRTPRWVAEGYATLIEGELTGAGRPTSDLRAAILRRWAQQGRMPSYSALDDDEERWRGMSMAYLAGSAFLEWLAREHGNESFRQVWARMTARVDRSFDAAFGGVFGASPEELYGRFVAELTERAMAAERTMAPTRRDGELWQRLTWTTGLPAVSPDGRQLAVVLRDRERPARLVVWSTGPDDEGEERQRKRIERMLALDPEDVAPVRTVPLAREPLHELPTVDGVEPRWPRWMPDGQSVVFVRYEPDAEGFLAPDLFQWEPQSGRVRRVTRGGRVWHPDPSPDGTWAVAVRHQYGLSQLVRVSLADGAIDPLTPPAVEAVHDHPRLSPDGRRLVYLRLSGGTWRAVVRDLETGSERDLDTPTGASLAHPAWSRDGETLYLSVGTSGLIDLHAFSLADGSSQQITRTQGAAYGSAPAGDGRLFFLSLEPHGFDLRVIDQTAEDVPLAPLTLDEGLWPAVPSASPARTDWITAASLPVRPYGLGRQEFLPLPGGSHTASTRAFEALLRGGDIVGRLGYLAAGSFARDGRGPRGGALAAVWRGWPVDVGAHAFTVREEPSRQPLTVPGLGTALDARQTGIEATANWTRRLGAARQARASGGVLVGSLEPVGPAADQQTPTGPLDTRKIFGEASYSATPSRGVWSRRQAALVRVERGRTGENDWHRATIGADIGAGVEGWTVLGSFRRRATRGNPTIFDLVRVGGVDSSVLPGSALHGRVLVPALPAGTQIGSDHESQRVTVTLGGGLPVFYERHRVWQAGGPRGEWFALVGIETRVDLPPIPLVRLPGAEVTVGVARLLDDPFRNRTRAWFGLTWRP